MFDRGRACACIWGNPCMSVCICIHRSVCCYTLTQPSWWVGDLWSTEEGIKHTKGYTDSWGIHKHAWACKATEGCLCFHQWSSILISWREWRRLGCLYLHFIQVLTVFYVGVEDSTWYIAICVISRVSIVCVCVCPASLLVEFQVRKQQPHPWGLGWTEPQPFGHTRLGSRGHTGGSPNSWNLPRYSSHL